jgi:hypothetical protein
MATSPFGIVVITEKPTPETAAQTLRTATLEKAATVASMETEKVTKPKR